MFRIFAVLSVLMIVRPLEAQERGQVALDASFDGSPTVGITWHASDHLAFRPVVGFSEESIDQIAGLPEEPEINADTSSFRAGLGVLWALSRTEEMSTYVGASYLYARTSTESSLSKYESDGNTLRAFVGLRRLLGKRLAAYGEAGIGWENRGDDGLSRRESDSIGSFTGALGLAFYFN
jgi:hypothetical protein